MRERDLGDQSGQKEIIKLVTEMSNVSYDLVPHFEEGETRVVSPNFSMDNSPVLLGGLNMSGTLVEMGQQINTLHVRTYSLPERNDDDEFPQAACRVWEIKPPDDKKSPGFELTIVVPELTEEITVDKLDQLIKTGSMDIVNMSWKPYKPTKPINKEKIILGFIKENSTASLEAGLLILKGLQSAKEIQAEKESSKLQNGA